MNKEELLQHVLEQIDPLGVVTADTEIAECDDLDSMALYNVVMYLKQELGKDIGLLALSQCRTVGDLVDLAMK